MTKYEIAKINEMITSSIYTPQSLQCLGITGSEYIQVECDKDTLSKRLDINAGIDWIVIHNDNSVMTYAVRNRFVEPDKPSIYRDFTIRLEKQDDIPSEYEKRKRAIEMNTLYPIRTIQCWYSASIWQCGAIMLTNDLYTFMKQYPECVKEEFSDRPFYAIKWRAIQMADFPITIIDKRIK